MRSAAEVRTTEAAAPHRPDARWWTSPRPDYIPDYATPRFRLTPRHFAYVKIAEGCNHPCSFCIIPRMRGSHRSRPQADIVAEAKALLADGVKELNLISQDSTYYGLDLRPNHSRAIASPEKFTAAVKSLPGGGDDDLHPAARVERAAGRFLDPPALHAPGALDRRTDRDHRRMSQGGALRGYSAAAHPREHAGAHAPRDLARIHRGSAAAHPRGHPRHRAAHDVHRRLSRRDRGVAFQDLLEFIRETRFERLGVFTYSQEEGTRAGSMAGQVPERTRQKRRELAMAAQHEIAGQVAESFVGRTFKVLVERETTAGELQLGQVSSWEHGLIRGAEAPSKKLKGRFYVARGEADAPDIDGRVYVRGHLQAGAFADVTVTGHSDYDLFADAGPSTGR